MVDTRTGFEILTGKKPKTVAEILKVTPTPVVTGGGVRRFAGPVQPGRDEEIFRRTGRTVQTGSLEAQQINQQFEQEQIRQREERVQQSLIREQKLEQQRQEQIAAGTIAGQVQREVTRDRTKEIFKSAIDPNIFRGVVESGIQIREIIRRRKEEPPIQKVKELFIEEFKSPVGLSLITGVPSKEPDITFKDIKQVVKEFPGPKVKEQIITKGAPTLAFFIPGVSKEKATKFLATSTDILGFESKVVGELIPETKGEAAIVGGAIGVSATFPIVRPLITGAFTFLGARTALAKELSVEERVAGGLVAGAGAVGLTFEGLPFVRGLKTRLFSSEFVPVKTQVEGFKAIELKEGELIGLIEPRKGAVAPIDLPPSSPLIKGGFGRRPGGEEIFLGKEQRVATSQIGLFKEGEVIKLEREFFVTPEEPFIKIAETRISRLGLQEFLKIPKEVEIGFGVPGKPQIGLSIADVGRIETPKGFKIGTGTELEAIKTFGEIKDVTKVGATVIKGQAVDIFEFKIGKGLKDPLDFKPPKISSTEGIGRISGEGLISTLGVSLQTRGSLGLSLPKPSDFFGTTIQRGRRATPTEFRITPFIPSISLPSPSSFAPSPPKPSQFSLLPSQPSLPSPRDFFPTPLLPPSRRRPVGKKVRKKIKKKGRKVRVPIRPSFTGIVLDIEAPATPISFAGVDLGIVPGQIRGLRTGLAPPKKKTKVKKSKKPKKKKK